MIRTQMEKHNSSENDRSAWNALYHTTTQQQPVTYENINGYNMWSRGSSVSIVSDYGLDDRDSIPGRGKGFFL
jgi:hypothetical protein